MINKQISNSQLRLHIHMKSALKHLGIHILLSNETRHQ